MNYPRSFAATTVMGGKLYATTKAEEMKKDQLIQRRDKVNTKENNHRSKERSSQHSIHLYK